MERGLFLSSSGKVVAYQNHRPGQTQGNKDASSEQSQDIINSEARDAIKDLFPNIPTKDLNQIVKTAFKKGKHRVGTAVELPLARRAQLAVVAHIRHIYTSYDRLLKMTSFQEARASVEEPTLAKLVLWRGDDENGATVLEDVFREVIVISDDEDDNQEDEEETEFLPPPQDDLRENIDQPSKDNRESQPIYHSINRPNSPKGTGHGPPISNRVTVDPPSQYTERRNHDHRGFRRYEAWDRARSRYSNCENNASFVPAVPKSRKPCSPQYSRTESRPEFPGREGYCIQLSLARDSVIPRTTDHIRKEVVTDPAQQINTYTPRRLAALQERDLQRHHQISDHASFSPAVERTQAYVYRQSPVPSNLHRSNQGQSRRSYPPSDDTRYGIAHTGQPHSQQGPIVESRDYPVIPSIESPTAPISRPERQDDIQRQSPKVISGPATSRSTRPFDNGLHPQLVINSRQERHWDDLSYSRVIGTPQRQPSSTPNIASPYSGYGLHLDGESRSPHVASQYQSLMNKENLTRPPLGQRAVRVGLGDTERYTHHTTEHRARGVSHPAAVANPADPRRISLRYPYPDNPAIVIRQRHRMNPCLVAYPADTSVDANNCLTQVRVYDRPVETRTMPDDARYQARLLPLENRGPPQQSNNRFAAMDKPYTYYVDNNQLPVASPPRLYRSPPPQIHSSESASTASHTSTAPQLGPADGYIRSQQPYTHRHL
ncbi:hypothetical protein McanCB56680_006571 [Microsporum canis]